MQLTYDYNHNDPVYIKQSQSKIYFSSQNEKIWGISEIYQFKKISWSVFFLLSSVNTIFINAKHRTRPISHCIYLSFVRTRVHDNGNYINTTGTTRGSGTAYPSVAPPVFNGVRVTRSLVLYVCFVDRCLSFCSFSFDHCVVCSSSIYGFWLSLWYLQTLLTIVWAKLIHCLMAITLIMVKVGLLL